MATVVNTPGSGDNDGGAGWAVAVIILIAVIGVGAYLWVRYQGTGAPISPPVNTGDANTINVTVPGVSATSNGTTTP